MKLVDFTNLERQTLQGSRTALESKTGDTVVLKKREPDIKFTLAFCFTATVK